MSAEQYQSWKFAFTVAAVVMIGMTGYKMMTRPSVATQIAQQRAANAFPNGEPSAEPRQKVLAEGMTALSLGCTLEEFEHYMLANNNEISWEPENDRSFVVRTTRLDPMTQQTNGVAFQMKVRDPSQMPGNVPAFAAGAIAVTAIAFNGEMVDPRVAQTLLFQIQTDIELRRQRGAL